MRGDVEFYWRIEPAMLLTSTALCKCMCARARIGGVCVNENELRFLAICQRKGRPQVQFVEGEVLAENGVGVGLYIKSRMEGTSQPLLSWDEIVQMIDAVLCVHPNGSLSENFGENPMCENICLE